MLRARPVRARAPCLLCPSGAVTARIPLAACPPPPPQGARKTKLGLREFVQLGDFTQRINTATSTAVRGLRRLHLRLPQHLRRGGGAVAAAAAAACDASSAARLRGSCLPCPACSQRSAALRTGSGGWCAGAHGMATRDPIPRRLQENVVDFSVVGLGTLSGSLTVKAAYTPQTDSRVGIQFLESTLVRGAGCAPRSHLTASVGGGGAGWAVLAGPHGPAPAGARLRAQPACPPARLCTGSGRAAVLLVPGLLPWAAVLDPCPLPALPCPAFPCPGLAGAQPAAADIQGQL
jgi:hypothetical protein